MEGLKFNNVVIKLNGRVLLTLNATVLPGETLTVMGPSGSGKSSLLAYIGGFLSPAFEAEGEIILNGQKLNQLPAQQRHTGILFQDPLLFPHMSVGENLLFALPASGPTFALPASGRAREQKFQRIIQAEEALAEVDLAGFFSRDPATLSGGQKARVALVRVLLSKPSALLLDEPFSKLDAQLRDQIRKLVFNEARRQNLPTVLVSHDVADAKAANGEVINLEY